MEKPEDRNIHVGKSWPRPATPCNLVPKWEGEFRDHADWVNFASSRLTVASDSNGHPLGAICVDTLGRRCANGRDFRRAHEEGTFPVRYFFECVPDWPDAPLPGQPIWCGYDAGAELPLPDSQLENGGACS